MGLPVLFLKFEKALTLQLQRLCWSYALVSIRRESTLAEVAVLQRSIHRFVIVIEPRRHVAQSPKISGRNSYRCATVPRGKA